MSTDDVLERVERHGGDVRARLWLAGALTFSGELPIDLAIRDWSRRGPGGRRTPPMRRQPAHGLLRVLFGALCPDEDEVEARRMLAFSLMTGNHFMAADHGAHAARQTRWNSP